MIWFLRITHLRGTNFTIDHPYKNQVFGRKSASKFRPRFGPIAHPLHSADNSEQKIPSQFSGLLKDWNVPYHCLKHKISQKKFKPSQVLTSGSDDWFNLFK